MSSLCESLELEAPSRAIEPDRSAAGSAWRTGTVEPAAAWKLKAGEIWIVELSPRDAFLSPIERHALTSASVIIYDRALGPAVAAVLPLGSYAEPAAADDAAVAARSSERCLGFARDGWRVVRVVEAGLPPAIRAERLRRFVEFLLAHWISRDLPVQVGGGPAGGGFLETTLGRLVDRLDGCAGRRTIAFGAIGTRVASSLDAVSWNGLAG